MKTGPIVVVVAAVVLAAWWLWPDGSGSVMTASAEVLAGEVIEAMGARESSCTVDPAMVSMKEAFIDSSGVTNYACGVSSDRELDALSRNATRYFDAAGFSMLRALAAQPLGSGGRNVGDIHWAAFVILEDGVPQRDAIVTVLDLASRPESYVIVAFDMTQR